MTNPENGFYPSEGRVEFIDFDDGPDLIDDEYFGKGLQEQPVKEFLDKNSQITGLIAIIGAKESNRIE